MGNDRRIYAIDSPTEAERLERQAQLAGIEQHLNHVPLTGAARILDVGCGPGSMARLMAAGKPEAQVVGVDLRPEYLEFARELAKEDGLANVDYVEGDAFDLPFEDGAFDLVWHKYLLQWVHDPKAALAEMKRVTRPGGIVVSCVFDGFMREHYPVDEEVQGFVDKVMPGICDCYVARKTPVLLQELGFEDIQVEVERDRLFSFVGAIGAELRKNLEIQWNSAFPYVVKLWGDEAEAARLMQRMFEYYDRADTFTTCNLYFVTARVPEG